MPETGQGLNALAAQLGARLRAIWRNRQRAEAVVDRAYPAWRRRQPRPAPDLWATRLQALKTPPLISIVMPVHNPNPAWLAAAIASVQHQFYQNWELLITDDASAQPPTFPTSPRIDVQRLPIPAGISAASNAALARATGEYVTFLDHDDTLAPHALAAVACEIAAQPSLDLIFSDEDQIEGRRYRSPYFKPGWNPDLLLSQNAICHLAVYRRTLVTAQRGLRPSTDGAQDFDLALRVAGNLDPRRVRHVPQVLYHWRQSPGSASAATAERCRAAATLAITDHLRDSASAGAHPALPNWPAVRFRLNQPAPKISVIGKAVPTTYEAAQVEWIADPAWASGEILVFLHPALRPMSPDWLTELAAHASRPEIGVAGARLLAPNGTLLQAGYWLDPAAIAHSPTAAADDPGYRGQYKLPRSVSAVSADCLAVRRLVFEAAGGFTAAAGDFKAVDLCLKLAARGLRTVWTPFAELQYAVAPAVPRVGAEWVRSRWGRVLAADPYVNPNLRLQNGRVGLARGAEA